MGCLKLAHIKENKPVLKCVWNAQKQSKTGVGIYDYGARFYDPVLGRWHVSDILSEKYYSISPYAYVANNPVKLIDPNGMEISGDTTAVNNLEDQAGRGVKSEQKRQGRINNRIAKRTSKGKSTNSLNRRLSRSEFRETHYQATIDEIGVMRASSNVYDINTSFVPGQGDPAGHAEYVSTDANGDHTIRLNVSQSYLQNGGLAHELVHGYQFETGNIDFQSNGSPGLLYDIIDEVGAFQRQFVFTGNSTIASPAYIRNLNPAFYGSLPSGGLNTNTSYFMLMFHHRSYIQGGNRFIHIPYKNIGYPLIYNK